MTPKPSNESSGETPGKQQPKIKTLELKTATVENLTETETEAAKAALCRTALSSPSERPAPAVSQTTNRRHYNDR